MARREDNNDTHQTIPTPNPQERALFVTVKEEVFAENPDILPAPGTRYSEVARTLFAADYKRQFDDYIYIEQRPNRGSGDGVLVFGKPKTEEEKNTPFREFSEFGNHYWPPMLLMLRFIPDRNFPITTQGPGGQMIVGYRHYVREVFIPGANEGSLFITREFFASSKFDIGQHPVPEPTAVSYDYLGAKGSFPECLHDRIRIPSMRTAFASYTTGGGSAGASGVLSGQIFPATNFTEWAPYIVSDKQTLTEGGWHRIQVEVFPPPIPDTIIR